MRQYNKDKPKKWGFKVFALCASKTGMILNFEMYKGKAINNSSTETARSGPPEKSPNRQSEVSIFDHGNSTLDPKIFNCLLNKTVEYSLVESSQDEMGKLTLEQSIELDPSNELEFGSFTLNSTPNATLVEKESYD